MTRDIAGGEAAEPREREHAVRIVLADAGSSGPRLRGSGRDRRGIPVVAEMFVDTCADELRQLEPGHAARLELGRSRCERGVGPGQPRGLRESRVRCERLGVVRAVRAGLALDDDPARELDVAIDPLQCQVEHDVPEGVVGALGIHVRAGDAQLVRDQPLVVVEVGGNDHQALTKRCDRPGIVVAERLMDQDGRAGDVLPVDLIVVDRPERRDQIGRGSGRRVPHPPPAAPPRPIRAHTVI